MSSAIEVLKELLERNLESAEYQKAVEEGILALEQIEKVKEIAEHWESWYELDEGGTGLEDLVDDLKNILKNKKVLGGKP